MNEKIHVDKHIRPSERFVPDNISQSVNDPNPSIYQPEKKIRRI